MAGHFTFQRYHVKTSFYKFKAGQRGPKARGGSWPVTDEWIPGLWGNREAFLTISASV
jgi:hypothetical protein